MRRVAAGRRKYSGDGAARREYQGSQMSDGPGRDVISGNELPIGPDVQVAGMTAANVDNRDNRTDEPVGDPLRPDGQPRRRTTGA